MLTANERRSRSIMKIAEKKGILQENGEYWDGTERRGKGRVEQKEEREDSSEEKSSVRINFFG